MQKYRKFLRPSKKRPASPSKAAKALIERRNAQRKRVCLMCGNEHTGLA